MADYAYARSCDRTAAQFVRADRRDRVARRLRIAAKILFAPIVVLVLGGAMIATVFGGRR